MNGASGSIHAKLMEYADHNLAAKHNIHQWYSCYVNLLFTSNQEIRLLKESVFEFPNKIISPSPVESNEELFSAVEDYYYVIKIKIIILSSIGILSIFIVATT